MAKKVLFTATVDYHFLVFHLPILRWFKDQGWIIHIAANGHLTIPYVDRKYDIPFERMPLKWNNVKAYQKLKSLLEEENYDLIHTHTPIGGVLTRLASMQYKKTPTKVIYTAHGFHFCKGAPLSNWLLYYPVEKFLARHTDCLITINEEDYRIATSRNFKATRIHWVNGVGVDTKAFKPMSSTEKRVMRAKFGYQSNQKLMIYTAEFNKNKNHQMLINVLRFLKEDRPNIKLLLAGDGPLLEQCRNYAKRLGVASEVDFLGYRNDISKIVPMCDLALSSSYREGLPVNIMETMACGLPVIATRNRGHVELIKEDENGYLVGCNDTKAMGERIKQILNDSTFSYG